MILCGLFGTAASFWFPVLLISKIPIFVSIDVSSMLQNVIGAFIFGVARSCSLVKYQYRQTYFIYDGIMCGFCRYG